MNRMAMVVGSAPGRGFGDKMRVAALRAVRTFLQGVAGALPTGGAGAEILGVGYWEMVGVAVIAAAFAAIASFIQNVATFLPDDPTQRDPGAG